MFVESGGIVNCDRAIQPASEFYSGRPPNKFSTVFICSFIMSFQFNVTWRSLIKCLRKILWTDPSVSIISQVMNETDIYELVCCNLHKLDVFAGKRKADLKKLNKIKQRALRFPQEEANLESTRLTYWK